MNSLLKSLRVALLSVFALAAAPVAHAQVSVNIGPPSWGPAVPAGSQYYYIPETNGFYDVPARQYVVRRDGRWVRTNSLSGYNTANFHPVIVDYVGAEPWSRYDEYRNRYPRGGNPSNGGLPPGQAKKLYRRGYGNGNGNGNGQYDGRRYERRDDDHDGRDDDRRRYERRDDDHDGRDDDRRRYERRDDDDNDRGNGNGKYKDKGKGKKDKD